MISRLAPALALQKNFNRWKSVGSTALSSQQGLELDIYPNPVHHNTM